MTQDEFLAWQEHQDRFYELVDGIPVLPLKMMTGPRRRTTAMSSEQDRKK